MSIGTAFFICAFGGILLGGAIGEVIERVKAKKAKMKKARRRAELMRRKRNSMQSFMTAALYEPKEKGGYVYEKIEVKL